MASVDDDRCGGDTFGIEVGNCIPSALALGIAVVVDEVEGCMANTTEQMERLNRKRSIASPIPLRKLYAQQPYTELATFPSYVVYHQLPSSIAI